MIVHHHHQYHHYHHNSSPLSLSFPTACSLFLLSFSPHSSPLLSPLPLSYLLSSSLLSLLSSPSFPLSILSSLSDRLVCPARMFLSLVHVVCPAYLICSSPLLISSAQLVCSFHTASSAHLRSAALEAPCSPSPHRSAIAASAELTSETKAPFRISSRRGMEASRSPHARPNAATTDCRPPICLKN